MNIHKSRKKGNLTVYPLGVIDCHIGSNSFCDVVDEKGHHVCCVNSIPQLDDPEEIKIVKGEGVIWDADGFPDIYLDDKEITFEAIKKGVTLLEKDLKNKFHYTLVRKNYMDKS
jgi:hypothetical protein